MMTVARLVVIVSTNRIKLLCGIACIAMLLHKPSQPASCSTVLQFTLVDASLAPFFLRLPVLKHYRGFDLPPVRLDTCCVLFHFLC